MTKIVKAARAAAWGRKAGAFLVAVTLLFTLALAGCSESAQENQTGQDSAQQALISVTVNAVAEAEGFEAIQAPAQVPEGATVFDALVASGIEYSASDSEYGKFVESLGGLAGTSSTAWVFTVNGEQVMEGCDSCVLSDGDVVEWSYISW